MGRSENLGSQNRTFYYNQGLVSSEFNNIFSKTIPAGVYEGGEIERVNDFSFRVHPISVVIEDANISQDPGRDITGNDIAVRIRTTSITAPLSLGGIGNPIDTSRCLIVARYSWLSDNPSNIPSTYDPGQGFMDFAWVTETLDNDHTNPANLWSTDLILGKLNFFNDGGTWIIHPTSQASPEAHIDYTLKSWSPVVNDLIQPRLRVRAPRTGEPPNTVFVESGFIRGKNGIIEVSGSSGSITNTTSLSRIDYVYIDEGGGIQIEEGIASSLPEPKPYYGRKVIAEIRRGAGRDSIRGDDIIQTQNFPIPTIEAKNLTAEDLENYYEKDILGFLTIEEALKQVWEKSIRPIFNESDPNEGDQKIFRHSSGTRFERDNVKDAVVIRGRDGGLNGYRVTITPGTLNAHRTLTLANGNTTLSPGTMATTDTDQAISGKKNFENTSGTEFRRVSGQDGIILRGNTHSSNPSVPHAVEIRPGNLTANRTVTLANADTTLTKGTMVSTDEDQTISSLKTFSIIPVLPGDDPETDNQAVRRKYVSDHISNNTNPHSATSVDTENRLIIRDSSGRARVKAPDNTLDIANKGYVDSVASTTLTSANTHADTKLSKSAGSGEQITGPLYTEALRPDTHNLRDLGTDSVRYKNGYFSGTVKSGAFDVTSARDKKDHINTFNGNAIDLLNKIEIVTFTYKDDSDQRQHIGMIADDVPWQFASLDRTGISLPDTVAVLIKAVQELNKKVKSLELKLESK